MNKIILDKFGVILPESIFEVESDDKPSEVFPFFCIPTAR